MELTHIISIIILVVIIYYWVNNDMHENFENYKHKLSIMAIFKNEEQYLDEWLQYHVNQGIAHFYLYCNDEDLKKYDYLDKYKHYITLIDWTKKMNEGSMTIQRQAYTHCVKNYNKQYDYIMMLDIDEFLVCTENHKKVAPYINSLDFDKTKALKVQRYDFGSNGHKKKPKGGVFENYTKHETICSSYKTIANSKFIDTDKNFYGVHDFNFIDKDGKIYNDYFDYKFTGFPNSCTKESKNEIPLVINHYYTKSYDEYIERCKLWENGGINTVGYRQNCETLFKKRDIV